MVAEEKEGENVYLFIPNIIGCVCRAPPPARVCPLLPRACCPGRARRPRDVVRSAAPPGRMEGMGWAEGSGCRERCGRRQRAMEHPGPGVQGRGPARWAGSIAAARSGFPLPLAPRVCDAKHRIRRPVC